MDAVEAAVAADTVDIDVHTGLRDELAECIRQLVNIVPVQWCPRQGEADAWINDTERGELVDAVGSLFRVGRTDFRCVRSAIVQPVVNVDGHVDWPSKDTTANSFVEDRLAEAVELGIDCVRSETTYVVEKGSRQRVSRRRLDSNVVATSKLIRFCAGIGELVVESDPSEDSLEVLARIRAVVCNTKLNYREQQRRRCPTHLFDLVCFNHTGTTTATTIGSLLLHQLL